LRNFKCNGRTLSALVTQHRLGHCADAACTAASNAREICGRSRPAEWSVHTLFSPISLVILSLSLSPFLLTSLLVCPASSTSSSLCDGALATASPSPPARPARRSVIELNIDMARADRASTLRWCVPTAPASTLAEVPLRPSAKMLETNSVQSCKFVPGCKVPSLLAQVEEAGTLGLLRLANELVGAIGNGFQASKGRSSSVESSEERRRRPSKTQSSLGRW